ncbi:hypothetical protein GCM10027417_11350 [Glutamicibacter endophyticus]
MMFPDTEEVQTEFVGERRVLDEIADHPRMWEGFAVCVDGYASKGVKAEFKRSHDCHNAAWWVRIPDASGAIPTQKVPGCRAPGNL